MLRGLSSVCQTQCLLSSAAVTPHGYIRRHVVAVQIDTPMRVATPRRFHFEGVAYLASSCYRSTCLWKRATSFMMFFGLWFVQINRHRCFPDSHTTHRGLSHFANCHRQLFPSALVRASNFHFPVSPQSSLGARRSSR